MKQLETSRLRIREYTEEDLPRLYEILSDPVTMSFWPQPFSLKQSEEWLLTRGLASYKQGTGRYAIELKATGELIGDAGIIRQELDGKYENDLGYIIDSPFWGQGFGYEAAAELLRYGFEDLGLVRLCANMPANHISSRKVAEKLGMDLQKEFINKKNRDIRTCLYSIERMKPVIKPFTKEQDIPYDLLLLADPSKVVVDEYIRRGYCFLAYWKDELVGEFVLIHTHPQTIEIVNIAVKEDFQGMGIGKALLERAIEESRSLKAKTVEIGTANSSFRQLKLYQMAGFRIFGVDTDFFLRHYDELIYEEGIQVKDMIRLRLEL